MDPESAFPITKPSLLEGRALVPRFTDKRQSHIPQLPVVLGRTNSLPADIQALPHESQLAAPNGSVSSALNMQPQMLRSANRSLMEHYPVPCASFPMLSFKGLNESQARSNQQGWFEETDQEDGGIVGTDAAPLQVTPSSANPLRREAGKAYDEGENPQNGLSLISLETKASEGRSARRRASTTRGLVAKRPATATCIGSRKGLGVGRVRSRAAPKAKESSLGFPLATSAQEGCDETPMESLKEQEPTSRCRQAAQKLIFITGKGQMQGSTPARLRSAGGGVEVMAKMYFHRKKLAWRAEVLINGTKRQKSFSCKLYGGERAKMMCEWARNFVLRTGRLPTDEETCASLAVLLEAPLPSEQKGSMTLDLQRWLHCFPPEAPRLVYRPLISNPDAFSAYSQDHSSNICNDHGIQSNAQPPDGIGALNATHLQIHARGRDAFSDDPTVPPNQPLFYQNFLTQPCEALQAEPLAPEWRPSVVKASPRIYRSLREQEAAMDCVFPELAYLPRLTKPKERVKRQNVGKKPHSGVRGMYFQQGSWRVNYRGAKDASSRLFPYPHGDFETMKQQHVLARIFLRQVIEKNRQIHDSDGDGLSDEEPEWLKRGDVAKLAFVSEEATPRERSQGSSTSMVSGSRENGARRPDIIASRRWGVSIQSRSPGPTGGQLDISDVGAKREEAGSQQATVQELPSYDDLRAPQTAHRQRNQPVTPDHYVQQGAPRSLQLFPQLPVLGPPTQTAPTADFINARQSAIQQLPSSHSNNFSAAGTPTPNSAAVFSADVPFGGEAGKHRNTKVHLVSSLVSSFERSGWTQRYRPVERNSLQTESPDDTLLHARQEREIPFNWQFVPNSLSPTASSYERQHSFVVNTLGLEEAEGTSSTCQNPPASRDDYVALQLHFHTNTGSSSRSSVDLDLNELPEICPVSEASETDKSLHKTAGYGKSRAIIYALQEPSPRSLVGKRHEPVLSISITQDLKSTSMGVTRGAAVAQNSNF